MLHQVHNHQSPFALKNKLIGGVSLHNLHLEPRQIKLAAGGEYARNLSAYVQANYVLPRGEYDILMILPGNCNYGKVSLAHQKQK